MTGEFKCSTAGVCLARKARGKQMVPLGFVHEDQPGQTCMCHMDAMWCLSLFVLLSVRDD